MRTRWLGRTAATVSTLLEEGAPPEAPVRDPDLSEPPTRAEVAEMLRAFGVALLEAGEATNDVRDKLLRIARAYAIDDAQVIVLPTVVFVQVPGDLVNRTEIESVSGEPLRLDQAGALERVVREAQTGTLYPSEADVRLAEIRAAEPPYDWKLTILGHTILTLGFGLSVNPEGGRPAPLPRAGRDGRSDGRARPKTARLRAGVTRRGGAQRDPRGHARPGGRCRLRPVPVPRTTARELPAGADDDDRRGRADE